jgi:hypothetical protein
MTTLHIVNGGDTKPIQAIAVRLIQYYGGWFALEPLPNGNYELTVKACDANVVQRHCERAMLSIAAEIVEADFDGEGRAA